MKLDKAIDFIESVTSGLVFALAHTQREGKATENDEELITQLCEAIKILKEKNDG